MALPWVRLDSGIAAHDKILNLLSDPSPKRWQAAASYMFALGWAGQHGTDGHIPIAALPFVHGSKDTARLLEKHRLWVESPSGGYCIHNYGNRQMLSETVAAKKAAQSAGAIKANCIRHHGAECGCWQDSVR